MVQLYFVLGWSCDRIALRYGFVRQRAQQVLHTWSRRAVETGYLQHIPPLEVFASAVAIQRRKTVPAHARPVPAFLPPLPVEKFPELPRRLQVRLVTSSIRYLQS